jgi:probable F420-dependent oxidoreductase
MTRPFRFIAPMPRLTLPVSRWLDEVRRIEDLGFSSVSISEHLTGGWVMEPLTALTVAAGATDRLRLLTLLLSNDFRHPVLLHKAAATLDVASGGRLELGIGAGWLARDYEASGIPFDSPAVRINRLAEAVDVIDGLFGPAPFSYAGNHYRIEQLDGLPKPAQRPRPPIMIGGGGRKILELAARVADIVGVHSRLSTGVLDAAAAHDLSAERIGEKVGWIREAAAAAGRGPDDVELQFSTYIVHVGDRPLPALAAASTFAPLLAADPALLASSPAVLVGSVDACVEALYERRERFGFSYLNLGSNLDAVAPIVARLAGQ